MIWPVNVHQKNWLSFCVLYAKKYSGLKKVQKWWSEFHNRSQLPEVLAMQDLLVPGWYPSNLRDALVLGLGPRLWNSNILFGHILQFSMLMALSELKKVEIVNHWRTMIRGLYLCTWSSTANWLLFIKKGYYGCFWFGIVYLALLCPIIAKRSKHPCCFWASF